MKADMAALKEKSASSSDSGGRLEGTRDLDRPPSSRNWTFPATTASLIRWPSSTSATRTSVLPSTVHHGRGAGVDGLLPSGGRRAALVRPTLGGRGHTDMGALQGPPQPAIWPSTPIGSPVRVGGVPEDRHRGGILQSVPSPPATCGSPGRSTAGPTLHRRSPTAPHPRRPHPQPDVASGRHESRAAGGIDGG